MDHRPLITASAFALDIDDVQSSAAKRPEPARRIRRQGPPSERHLALPVTSSGMFGKWTMPMTGQAASRMPTVFRRSESAATRCGGAERACRS
jgi:hypothetical protein